MARTSRVESFRDLCERRGLAVTHQRQVIFETLTAMHGHPSPEAVYDLVKERIPSISLATVYKNLKTFEEHGLVQEVSPHHGSARFETNSAPHHHLVCLRCKAIVDVPADDIGPVRLRKRAPAGFRIQRYSVEMHGLCGDCAQQVES
ncbi:MAG TPA: transcriptional repressor [Bryobacteraceae bacterium]|nr:transcriptional repressor [Bryobacteraceae bacterium]